MKRSGPIKRRTPLKAKGGRAITRGNDAAFLAWLRTRPCDIGRLRRENRVPARSRLGPCWGPCEAAHNRSRNLTGQDRGNAATLCEKHHQWQHTVGKRTFARLVGVSLAQLCREAAEEYDRLERFA